MRFCKSLIALKFNDILRHKVPLPNSKAFCFVFILAWYCFMQFEMVDFLIIGLECLIEIWESSCQILMILSSCFLWEILKWPYFLVNKNFLPLDKYRLCLLMLFRLIVFSCYFLQRPCQFSDKHSVLSVIYRRNPDDKLLNNPINRYKWSYQNIPNQTLLDVVWLMDLV